MLPMPICSMKMVYLIVGFSRYLNSVSFYFHRMVFGCVCFIFSRTQYL